MLVFVLPAYNEEADIGNLLGSIAQRMKQLNLDYRVLVVNDGSTDGTVSVVESFAKKMPLALLHNPSNKGLGVTIAKGLREASEITDSGDVIIAMDADNTHDVSYVSDMLTKLAGGNDVVIASRFAEGAGERGLSQLRKILSRGSSFLLNLFFLIRGVRDFTSGYRAYRAVLIKKAFQIYGDKFIEETGFTSTPEILIKLRACGAKMAEIPFVLRYDAKRGSSKIKIPRTIARYLLMFAKYKLRGY